MKKVLPFAGFVFVSHCMQAQVIISLIVGDKLNSGKVQFGLDGGLTLSDILGLEGARSMAGFNLGFYFDIKMKSPAQDDQYRRDCEVTHGAGDLPVYALDNPDLDPVFDGGKMKTSLRYFQVPVMMKYLLRNHFYVKAGAQLALLNKAYDEFYQTVEADNDLQYTIKNAIITTALMPGWPLDSAIA